MFEHRPFGNFLKLSVRGTSHASALGFSLENFPAGFRLDEKELAAFMKRRAPGQDLLSTQRKEADEVQFLEGVTDGRTTGGKIVGRIANTDCRPKDYGSERTVPRPGHADFGQWVEFGRIPSGGGANSGRLTAAMCATGGICRQWLARRGIKVTASISSIGESCAEEDFEAKIIKARNDGDSIGGAIRCVVAGLKPGLGGALFAGVESELSAAIFGIPGVKGIEFGNGISATLLRGSENDDPFVIKDGKVVTERNQHGGVLGGRTTGMPIEFTVEMKPTPTVFKPLKSVDLATMTAAVCEMKGRHDPCIVRRAVPVVEAVTALVLADMMLAVRAATPRICLTLTGATMEENLAQLKSQRLFTDMVELRVDLLSDVARASSPLLYRQGEDALPTQPLQLWQATLPSIITYRRKCDGGAFDGDDSERIAFFRSLLTSGALDCGEYYLDFEDDFRIPELESLAREHGVRIVRSVHCFDRAPDDLAALCRRMVAGTDEIAKVAFMPQSVSDVARLFEESQALADVPHVLCVMGPMGAASRTLAVRSGSLWSYASCSGLEKLGHLTPYELVRDYRFRTHTRDYALYGVTGWPLLKTRSPELHNAAFLAEDIDAVMASFPAETATEVVDLIRRLNLRGMAVTIPHKETIMPLLDEIAQEAREIGAVNTIVVKDGKRIGHNTDADGFAEALTAFLECERLGGKRVAVLGAGGASKAVVFALKRLGADVEIFHRRVLTPGFEVIVNATPVDPIPEYEFTGCESVYDLRYVPEETPLMARARAAGCRVENGFSMLIAQARRQRELWGR